MNPTIKIQLAVVVTPDGDEFYASCPALKGLHIDGATEQEAVENAAEAATVYIASLIRHGEALPVGLSWSRRQATRHCRRPVGTRAERTKSS